MTNHQQPEQRARRSSAIVCIDAAPRERAISSIIITAESYYNIHMAYVYTEIYM